MPKMGLLRSIAAEHNYSNQLNPSYLTGSTCHLNCENIIENLSQILPDQGLRFYC